MRLPESVQEIAEVIGRDSALYLVGQLPRCYSGVDGKKGVRVILYVPKRIKPDDLLVRILGWRDAMRLVGAFGGEILQPASCADVYRGFRDRTIERLAADGMKPAAIAALLEVSDRHVRNLLREIPQQEIPAANDNIAPLPTSQGRAACLQRKK